MEPPVRFATALLAVALLSAPTFAQAGVHMHLPHPPKHHRPRDAAPAAGTPTSDVPDAIWATGRTSR